MAKTGVKKRLIDAGLSLVFTAIIVGALKYLCNLTTSPESPVVIFLLLLIYLSLP